MQPFDSRVFDEPFITQGFLIMTRPEYKYFYVTRKIISSGMEYKIEHMAENIEEVNYLETSILLSNSHYKKYKTIKIEGPFTEALDDYLIIFKNKEIRAFLDVTARKMDHVAEVIAKGGEKDIEEIKKPQSPHETAENILRVAEKTAKELSSDCDKVCAEIMDQAVLLNESLLQNKQALNKRSINEVVLETFEISKATEADILIFIQKAAEELEQRSETARDVVRVNENKWAEQISHDGSKGLKVVLIDRELEKRRAAAMVAKAGKLAAGQLKAAAERAIEKIHSQSQFLINAKLKKSK